MDHAVRDGPEQHVGEEAARDAVKEEAARRVVVLRLAHPHPQQALRSGVCVCVCVKKRCWVRARKGQGSSKTKQLKF